MDRQTRIDATSNEQTLTDEFLSAELASGEGHHGAVAKSASTCGVPFVVGVGASAGGLEALERLFDHVPADSGLAYVVVQHLSPDFKSLMGELLGRRTSMRVLRVEDSMPIEPDTVYLIPPKKNLFIEQGLLRLRDQTPGHGPNLPIDFFFRSLAHELGNRAVAIVLSGSGSDGAHGIRAVKEAGGMVMVQDETTARFDGMPRSAVATGAADYVLPPEAMPEPLLRYVRHQPGLVAAQPHDGEPPRIDDQQKLDRILILLRNQHGVDFTGYRKGMLTRRIERRMFIRRFDELGDYLDHLRESPGEVRLLFHELLIGVTKFFRDQEAFRTLEERVVPELIASCPPGEMLRVWVPACSTGEEAYSLAILMLEAMEAAGRLLDAKVFATDVDQDAISRAAAGNYPETIAADIPPGRLERFFVAHGDQYQVRPNLRQLVIFAAHNALRDPPFRRMDLISCRNLLIYLEPESQQKLLRLLLYALRPGGILMLGASETPLDLLEHLELVDARWRIYRKVDDAPAVVPGLASEFLAPRGELPSPVPLGRRRYGGDPNVAELQDLLISSCLPPGVLVNVRHEVLYVVGDAGRYLKVPEGLATTELPKLVGEDLSIVLSTALHKAASQDQEVVYANVPVPNHPGGPLVRLRVRRLKHRTREELRLLVLFEEIQRPSETDDTVNYHGGEAARERIGDLELDLRRTRENLQATIEELGASNEELQATNEELLASNEELQSTNEELHSVNEELFTVNAEYQAKIAELVELNADIDNLFQATQIGTVFLDAELCVRKFTPAAQEVIRLVERDVGRPIEHLSHRLRHDHLIDDLRQVLHTRTLIERQLQDRDGRSWLVRLLPYQGGSQADRGVLMTTVDISDAVAAEAALRASRQMLQATLDVLPQQIAILDAEGVVLSVNAAWRQFSVANGGPVDPDIVGTNYLEICEQASGPFSAEAARVAVGLREVRDGRRGVFRMEYPCHAPGEQRWFSVTITRFTDEGGPRLVVAHDDITARRLAEESVRQQAAQLEAARDELAQRAAELAERNEELARSNQQLDEFAYMASHDLKEPLHGLRMYAGMLLREHGSQFELPVQERLLAMDRQAAHMERLIESLLQYSRVNRQPLRLEAVDLHDLVMPVLESLEPLAATNQVEIRLPRRLPVETCDRLTSEVFRNLIANAIKYNDKPQRWVEVGYTAPHELPDEDPYPEAGRVARFYVRDNGIGIKPRHLEAVFEIFRRLHPRDRFGGGTGAGLTISRRIIQRHQGQIWIESQPGEGTTVWFTLQAPA